jgi:hypothetical protein
MDRYPPVAEHGLIGDLQTAALVASAPHTCMPPWRTPSTPS